MAAPHVTGAAALVLQGNRSATPAQVWAAINADSTRGPLCCDGPDKLLHVKPMLSRPSAPRSLRAAAGNRSVRLAWTLPASNGGARISDYVVQRSANGGRTWSRVRDRVSATRQDDSRRSHQRPPLPLPGRRQERRRCRTLVRAVAAIPATNPSAPRSLATAAGNRSVRLTWARPMSNGGASITDYLIQRSANGGRTWTRVFDRFSSTRTATVGGLTNGHRYHFRVAAKNAAGVGPWSRAVAAIPATNPSAPRSLATAAGNRSVRLSWARPMSNGGASITDYVIQRSANGGRTWTRVFDRFSSTRTATVGDLTNGHRYYFRVAAKNRAGVGPWSRAVAAVPATSPSAPRSIGLSAGDQTRPTDVGAALVHRGRTDHGLPHSVPSDGSDRMAPGFRGGHRPRLQGHRPDQRQLVRLPGRGEEPSRRRAVVDGEIRDAVFGHRVRVTERRRRRIDPARAAHRHRCRAEGHHHCRFDRRWAPWVGRDRYR